MYQTHLETKPPFYSLHLPHRPPRAYSTSHGLMKSEASSNKPCRFCRPCFGRPTDPPLITNADPRRMPTVQPHPSKMEVHGTAPHTARARNSPHLKIPIATLKSAPPSRPRPRLRLAWDGSQCRRDGAASKGQRPVPTQDTHTPLPAVAWATCNSGSMCTPTSSSCSLQAVAHPQMGTRPAATAHPPPPKPPAAYCLCI